MWAGNRMMTGTCPCCKVCKKCPGFQKLLDRPDSGFILYRHVTRVEDINKKSGVIEATTDTIDDVFIIENTQGAALQRIDLTPEFDRDQISCPRCVNILKHAQSLFKNQEIGNNDIIGVCEHCRQKSQRGRTCLKCDEIVEKFQLSKSKGKQTHAQRVKTWLSKVQQLITLALDEDKGKKTSSPMRRGHSDLDISKLFRKVAKTDHEPEIEDLFLQNIRGLPSAMKGPTSERSYFPGAAKEVAFHEPDETRLKYGTPQEGEDFQPLLHSQSNVTLTEDELEKDFIRKYGKSFKEKRAFEDPTAKVCYVDQKFNEFIPSGGRSYDDEDFAPTRRKRENIQDSDTRHGGIRGKDNAGGKHYGDTYILDSDSRHESVIRKKAVTDADLHYDAVRQKELFRESDSRHEGDKRKESIKESDSRFEGVRRKEPMTDIDSRHEGVRRKELVKESDSRHEGVKRKEPIKESDSRHEGVRRKESNTDTESRHKGIRRKELLKESDSRYESGRRKELIPTESKHYESDKKKGYAPDSDSRYEGGKRKDQVPSKYPADDKNRDFISAPKSRHEDEKKMEFTPKASIRRDDEAPVQIKKRAAGDITKEDFISVIGRRFEEEIAAKGLTLASKKKRKDLTTASETRLEYEKQKDIILTDKDLKTQTEKKEKPGTKILFESPTRIKKYHSEESLIAGISKMNEEIKKHKIFDIYFPEKPGARKKKLKAEGAVSSAELIKDTIDKMKTKTEEEKRMRQKADKMKEERSKKLEEDKLDREMLLAEKMAAKLAREAEKEQKEREKEMESGLQDTSKKDRDATKTGQDLYKNGQDLSNKNHDASKQDRDTFKRDQDASKKDRDAFKRDKDTTTKDMHNKDKDKTKFEDEKTKGKIAKEKMVTDKVDKKGKEGEIDITTLKIEKGKETKSKDEDQFKAAKIKAKEEKFAEEKTKDKKGKGVNIIEKEVKVDKEIKLKEGAPNKQTPTSNKRDPEAENLLKQLEQEAKEREKLQQELRQQKEEERRMKLGVEQKSKETANQLVKKDKRPEPTSKLASAKDTTVADQKPKEAASQLIKKDKKTEPTSILPRAIQTRPKILDLIVPSNRPKERKNIKNISPFQIKMHGHHRHIKHKGCDICHDSDLELDLQSLLRQKQEALERKDAVKEAVIGETILKFKTQMPEPQEEEGIKPVLFQKQIEVFGQEIDYSQLNLVLAPEPEVKPKQKSVSYD